MKLVLDFIPNHSSDHHDWFQRSLAMEDPYTDYYVWLDPKGFDDDGEPIPPNNWVSRCVSAFITCTTDNNAYHVPILPMYYTSI